LHRTELVLSYLYEVGFGDLDFGYSSALAYIMAAIVFSISRFQMRFLKTSALGG
jgi:multiple sugar transport system permease protein